MSGIQWTTPIDIFKQRSREFMEVDLKRSDLDEHTLYSTPLDRAPMALANSGWCLAAYRIQYWTPGGEPLEGMWRDRIEYKPELTAAQLKERGFGKYLGPTRAELEARSLTTTTPYLYPVWENNDVVVICEGEKKAALVAERWKYCTIGIGGKDMWGERDTGRVIHGWTRDRINQVSPARIVIVADRDIFTRDEVKRSYANHYAAMIATFPDSTVQVMAPPDPFKGIDDWLAVRGQGELADLEEVTEIEMAFGADMLVRTYRLLAQTSLRGVVTIHPVIENVSTLLERHNMFKERIRYNLDTATPEIDSVPLNDFLHGTNFQRIFQRFFHMPRLGFQPVMHGIEDVAHKNSYSSSQEAIVACGEWDGVDKWAGVFGWLDETTQAVLREFVRGYVKRIMYPGSWWRFMPILTGPQGVGKTGFARWVAGSMKLVYDIPRGSLVGFGENKDLRRRLMNAGIALCDELSHFGHGERGELKNLVQLTDVTLRLPYGRADMHFVRRGVMMGTTNHENIIPNDPTGNTRFAVAVIPSAFNWEYMNSAGVWQGVISQAWAEVVAGGGAEYQLQEIDWTAQEEHMETSLIEEKLIDFMDLVKEKVTGYLPNGVDLVAHKGLVYFKAERYWMFFNNGQSYRPKDWERKALTQIAIKVGLVYLGRDAAIRLPDKSKLKSVYGIGA